MPVKLAVSPIAKFQHVHAFAFSPDGKHLVALPSASPGRLFETSDWKLVRQFEKSAELGAAAFSPDGETVALASSYLNLGAYCVSTGQPLWRWSVTEQWDEVQGLIVSPSTPEVIYANSSNRVLVFDLNSGEPPRELHIHRRNTMITAIALSPDGSCLATSWNSTYNEKTPFESQVILWSWPDGRELRNLNLFNAVEPGANNARLIRDLCFASSDRIAAISGDGAVALFDAVTGERSLELRSPTGDSYGHVATSPNGRYCAVSDRGHLLLWDLVEIRLVRDLTVNEHSSNGLGFSPNSELLAFVVSPRVLVFRVEDLLQ